MMDKRSLLFIVALAFTMFAVNFFFTYQGQETNKQWVEQQQAKKAETQQKLAADITQRTAKASQLPLFPFYSEQQAQHQLGTAVQEGNSLLTLAWTDPLPTTIYGKNGETYSLIAQESAPNSPALYAKNSSATLHYFDLPSLGNFDLQLVTVQGSILLGELKDGHITIPSDAMQREVNRKLPPALVLFKTSDNGYLSAGTYDFSQNHFTSLQEFRQIASHLTKYEIKAAPTAVSTGEEKYYVLENDYQQLVFSNKGGALTEINLPFESKSDRESVVKEIGIDRQMIKDHPYNALFPAHGYSTPATSPAGPYVEHAEGKLGGYYPLLRRDLIQPKGRQSVKIEPANYSLNIVSEYPEMAQMVYQVKSFDNKSIVFEAVQAHRRITKTFTLSEEAPYCLTLDLKVEGDNRGLWITTGIPEVEWISGGPAPALKYRLMRNQKVEIENLSLPSDSITVNSIAPDWICNSNGFLGLILQPLTEIDSGYKAYKVSGAAAPSRLIEIDQEYNRYPVEDLPGYAMALPLKSSNSTMRFRIYAGPFAESTLKAADKAFIDPATGTNPDYIASQSFHGWFAFISEPFAKFLFILMKFFYLITGSWALSIVLLTVALRLMLYPLNAWSMKSMARMQQIAPEVTAIQERFKKDQKKAQMEIMNLYRERGINPISGCFPLLIQMPFLIGMFDLLKSTFELRGASFIPGWIDNLTAPDVLFSWSYPIFFIGTEFHLLPILLGLVMFLQQRFMSPGPKDPSLMTDQQRQQRAMGSMMAVVFCLMFYNFPSGLNIYWLSSMILGVGQQWITNKQIQQKKPDEVIVVQPKKQKKSS